MEEKTYGNFKIYYDDTFVFYTFKDPDPSELVESLKNIVQYGIVERECSHSGTCEYYSFRPRITKKNKIILEVGHGYPDLDIDFTTWPGNSGNLLMKCIGWAKTMSDIFSEKAVKCGNRRLKNVFGNFIEIQNLAPIVSRFEGEYRGYEVKGINLGHTFFTNGFRYLMGNDNVHIASEASPRITYKVIEEYKKKFPGEEIIGFVGDPEYNNVQTIKVKRDYGDCSIEVIVNKSPIVPEVTKNGIIFNETSPKKIDSVFNKISKFINDIGVEAKKVKVLRTIVMIETRGGNKIVITPYNITINARKIIQNDFNALPIIMNVDQLPIDLI